MSAAEAPPAAPADTFDPAELPPGAAIRPQQIRQIRALLPGLGLTEAEVCKGAGVARLEDLTAVRAQHGLAKLQAAVRAQRRTA